MAPLEVVHELFAAISAGDADRACALVTEDVRMECTALGDQRGREVMHGTLVAHVAHLDSVSFETHREALVDGTVMNERTDRFVQGDRTVVTDAVGVFEFASDGRISRWKDYFDPLTLDAIPPALAPKFWRWEAIPALSAALAMVEPSQRGNVGLDGRRAAFEALIDSICPDLDPDRRKGIAAVMRELTSGDTWHVLTHRHWVTTGVAAAVTAWTTDLQLAALRAGDLPASWFPDGDGPVVDGPGAEPADAPGPTAGC